MTTNRILGVLLLALIGAAAVMGFRMHARSRAEAERAQREARQQPAAEIAPTPLAAIVPLAGTPGVDADGYPTQYVDRAALRSLLRARRFDELTKLVEGFQDAFEKDPLHEYWPHDAAAAFKSAEPDLAPLLDAWIQAAPASFAPWLGRAAYRVAVGFAQRGGKWAKDTHDSDFAAMHRTHALALADLDEAVHRRPKLVAALELKLTVYQAMTSLEDLARTAAAALNLCSACMLPRVAWIHALEPRWGGSYESMAALADSAPVARNKRLRFLAGYINLDKATVLAHDKQYDQALTTIERACALGDYWKFLAQRAEVEMRLQNVTAAHRDIDQALALRPGEPEVLFPRAWILSGAKAYEEAGRALVAGLRMEPTSSEGRQLRDGIVSGLIFESGKLYKEEKRADSLRVLELATELDPGNTQVQSAKAFLVLNPTAAPAAPAGNEIDLARARVASAPDDFRVHQRLDYLLAQQHRFDEVIAMWTTYLAAHASDGPAYLERGGAYFQAGRRAEAGADATKACQLGVSEGCMRAKSIP